MRFPAVVIILAVMLFDCVLGATMVRVSVSQQTSEKQLRMLMAQLDSGGSSAPQTFSVRKSTERDESSAKSNCTATQQSTRVMSVGGSHGGGGSSIIIDKRYTFFKTVLNFSMEEVERTKEAAFSHWMSRFGFDASVAEVENRDMGGFSSRDGSVLLFPFYFNLTLFKFADSDKLVDCPRSEAMWGGWLVEGDLLLAGEYAGPVGRVYEHAHLLHTYMVFAPNGPNTSVVLAKSATPMLCPDTDTCALVDFTEMKDDKHGNYAGMADTVLAFENNALGQSRTVIRTTLMWPGRF